MKIMDTYEYVTFYSSDSWVFPDDSQFTAWLEGFDPHLLISRDWTTRGCPMWLFLKHHGWDGHRVHPTGEWSPDGDDPQRYWLPGWAAEFVWWSFHVKPRSMTAQDCINLIDNPCYRPAQWENRNKRVLLRTL